MKNKKTIAITLGLIIILALYVINLPKGSQFDYFNELANYDVCVIDRNYYGEKINELQPKIILDESQKSKLQDLILTTKYNTTSRLVATDSMYSIIIFDEGEPLSALYVFDESTFVELENYIEVTPKRFLNVNHDQMYKEITTIIVSS